jgi:large subunit ribosomal protein L9
MDVLLLEDVYNVGRAGEVKAVANGFGRNYLIPQGMALPATPGAVEMAEAITEKANKERATLNTQMEVVAEQVREIQLLFPARAGETGKLYGSVTTAMIAEQLSQKIGMDIDKRQIHSQPLRLLGLHAAGVRLTVDVIPEFEIVVYREGENPENYMIVPEELAGEASPMPDEEELEAIAAEDAAEEAGEDVQMSAEDRAEPALEEDEGEAEDETDEEAAE